MGYYWGMAGRGRGRDTAHPVKLLSGLAESQVGKGHLVRGRLGAVEGCVNGVDESTGGCGPTEKRKKG